MPANQSDGSAKTSHLPHQHAAASRKPPTGNNQICRGPSPSRWCVTQTCSASRSPCCRRSATPVWCPWPVTAAASPAWRSATARGSATAAWRKRRRTSTDCSTSTSPAATTSPTGERGRGDHRAPRSLLLSSDCLTSRPFEPSPGPCPCWCSTAAVCGRWTSRGAATSPRRPPTSSSHSCPSWKTCTASSSVGPTPPPLHFRTIRTAQELKEILKVC